MKKRLCVFPNDTLHSSFIKGEVKDRYFNPLNLFSEIHVISLAPNDISPDKVSKMFGKADAFLHVIGPKSTLGKILWRLLPEIYYLISLERVIDVIRNIDPRVIRAYNTSLQGFLATIIGRRLKIPTVVSLHSSPDYDFKFLYPRAIIFWSTKNPKRMFSYLGSLVKFLTIGRMLHRFSLKLADKVICAYQYPLKIAKKYGRSDAVLIYNRVDLDRFAPVSSSRANDKLKILSVGVLTYMKNPENLVKSVRNLPVKLVLVGDGELRNYIEGLVRKLNIAHKVQFVYRVEHSNIHRLYREADIFVACLKIAGVSIPMLEAMASGLPIIYTRGIYEGKKEIIDRIGIEVDDNPQAIEEAVKLLIRRSDIRDRLGRMARERILEISGEKMEKKEATIYSEMMGNSFERI